jgi:hypothetical protein
MFKHPFKTFFALFAAHAVIFLLYFLIKDGFAIWGALFVPADSLVSTQGEITLSQDTHFTYVSGGRGGGGTHSICHFKIRYTYQVQEKTYSSTHLNFQSRDIDCRKAYGYTQKYKFRSTVTVYYLPSFPRLAVLEPKNRLDLETYTYQYLALNGFLAVTEFFFIFFSGKKISSTSGKVQVSFIGKSQNRKRAHPKQTNPRYKGTQPKPHRRKANR